MNFRLSKYIRFVCISILLVLAIKFPSLSRNEVLIFNEYTASDTVDMGMCVVGDSLETIFNIINLSGKVLKIGGNDYTFLIGRATDDPNDLSFFEFYGPRDLPRTIDTNHNYVFKVKYVPFTPSVQFPVGKKVVLLRIGVFDPAKSDPPASMNDLEKKREFILIARKSDKELDVFENVIDFDSVWVEPRDTIRKILIVQNNTLKPLAVDSIIFLRSLNAEIRLERKPLPIVFEPYRSGDERRQWLITYYPTNLGKDTALLSFAYRSPYNPDSVKYSQTIIRGVGVSQKLKLHSVENAEVIDNFIDLGSIPLDTTKEVKIYVQNNGNLPFNFLKQEILNYYTETPSSGFRFVDTLNGGKSLLPTQIDSFKVIFQPTQRDTFLARITFHSDIVNRKIIGYPESAKRIVFNIRGVGLAPKLAADLDSIDFGNIIINNAEGCPTIRDTTIHIVNNGNYVLRVENARIEPPYPQTPFKILEENFEVPSYSRRSLKVIFDSTAKTTGLYEANLVLTSSFSRMHDTLKIKLKAYGVLPDPINLSLPQDISFKPGNVLSIPVLVEKEKISRVKEYSDTLLYNPLILRFRNYNLQGTASEKIDIVRLQENGNGLLSIYLKTKWNEYFLPHDTLILLNFDTFLGNEFASPLEFLSPRFGDGICSRALTPVIQSTNIKLDSLCGLGYKIYDGSKGVFFLDQPTPNPATTTVNINFGVAFEVKTSLAVYDSYGNTVEKLVDNLLEPNIYEYKLDISNLPKGVYFVQFVSGIYREVKYFVKTY